MGVPQIVCSRCEGAEGRGARGRRRREEGEGEESARPHTHLAAAALGEAKVAQLEVVGAASVEEHVARLQVAVRA